MSLWTIRRASQAIVCCANSDARVAELEIVQVLPGAAVPHDLHVMHEIKSSVFVVYGRRCPRGLPVRPTTPRPTPAPMPTSPERLTPATADAGAHPAAAPAVPAPSVGLALDARQYARAAFLTLLGEHGLRFTEYKPVTVGADAVERTHACFAGEPLLSAQVAGHRTEIGWLAGGDGRLAEVVLQGEQAWVTVAATDQGAARALLTTLSDAISVEPSELAVPLTFWSASDRGGRSLSRTIAVPAPDTLAHNYEADVATSVGALLAADPPVGGRLILWHGPPGTGKTNALRLLAKAWEPWCRTHVVTDPDAFLKHSAYVTDVLASGDPENWKLVVLEDAGELLTADAQARTGQGLARLLNLSDGLLGQGMNVITLVTTNEPLGTLHPAVVREGRCWQQLEFAALSAPAANAWFARAGSSQRVDGPTTLADLYARLAGREPVEAALAFGFAA